MKKKVWKRRAVLEELVLHYNTMDYLFGENSLHARREGGKVWRPIVELEDKELALEAEQCRAAYGGMECKEGREGA